MKKRVLITGGLGYLGVRIAGYLDRISECEVIVSRTPKKAQIPPSLNGCRIVPLELVSKQGFDVISENIDCIIHLASIDDVESLKNPVKAVEINCSGTINLLEEAVKQGIKRFFYMSTAHVYGLSLAGRVTEKKIPKPVHPYAISHKAAEDFVLAAQWLGNLTGVVCRLSNSFGPSDSFSLGRWKLLVNDLARQAVQTGRLKLKSSGLQRRDFITITDVCRAVAHFLNLPAKECGDGLFNLGGGVSERVIEMAKRISERCAKKLSFTPDILRLEPTQSEKTIPLDYRIDKLNSTGFSLTGPVDDEIDALLLSCKEQFAK